MAYRETAMRHGDKWLRRREAGVRQHLRKGKGDSAELSGKLAMLLEVRGERQALAGKMRETIGRLEVTKKQLYGMEKAIEKEIAESEPVRRKKEVEARLEGVMREIDEAAGAAYKLIVIQKNGLSASREVRDFWGRLLP